MLPAAKEKMLAPLASAEEIFFLAAGVDVAALETHQGASVVRGKKPHQGIFSKNRTIAVGATWVKWPGTHQDRSRSWSKTVLGSALDANGNTLSDPSGKSYSWDFENQMVQAVVPGTGTVAFKYDPFGRRVYKSSPTFTGIFAYDGDNLIETTNGSGVEVAGYTQNQGVDDPLAELRSGGSSYYEADGLGSITSLSSSTGSIANTYTYDSFGNVTNFTGTLSNPFHYTGREFDSETGAYFYRARYYDSTIGRFISEDPIQFKGGIDFYAYVVNNPLNLTDANGLAPGGGGRESCSYYDKHCKYGCNGSSSYECRAGGCCRSFPENPKANCTRECLINWEIADCSNMTGSQQAACRRLAHLVCYRKCKFFPNPFTLPAACWSIADGY